MNQSPFLPKLVLACLLLMSLEGMANNIQVTNVSLTDQNTTDNFTMIEFDISWENSWRLVGGPANWDAAWVFVKYRVGAGPWLHAWINNTGHAAPSGSTISTGLLDPGLPYNNMTNPGMGAFIYRSGPGSGNFSLVNVKLRWNYGDNGLDDNAQVDIKVFAIEHVYVPSGAFHVGSGGAESGAFYRYEPPAKDPYQVIDEGAINVGQNIGELYYDNPSGFSGDRLGPIPAAFPKGFNAVYVMKYEVSQQGYVEFLNTLGRTQQTSRVRTNIAGEYLGARYVMSNTTQVDVQGRNGISAYNYIGLPPAPVTFFCDFNPNDGSEQLGDGMDIASSWMSWADLAAYLDWAGLRPISELEFEKVSRGPVLALPNEFVWGGHEIRSTGLIYSAGMPTESPDSNVNCSAGGTGWGPIRCGAFARPSTNRTWSGGSFFGVMELGGNLWERVISVGHPDGRAFSGKHGDGMLDPLGNANVTQWPDATTSTGSAFRGGSFETPYDRLRTSDRFFAANADPAAYPWTGGRGGRSSQ